MPILHPSTPQALQDPAAPGEGRPATRCSSRGLFVELSFVALLASQIPAALLTTGCTGGTPPPPIPGCGKMQVKITGRLSGLLSGTKFETEATLDDSSTNGISITWTPASSEFPVSSSGTLSGTTAAPGPGVPRPINLTGTFKDTTAGACTITITGSITNCAGNGTWMVNCGGSTQRGEWVTPPPP